MAERRRDHLQLLHFTPSDPSGGPLGLDLELISFDAGHIDSFHIDGPDTQQLPGGAVIGL